MEMNMNKWGKGIAAAALLIGLTACGSGDRYTAGTYEGKGKGYSAATSIRLSVTIGEDGAMHEIKVLEADETRDIGGKAIDKLISSAVAKNSAEVDTITGATRTSEGFREALKAALEQAQKGK